VGIGCDDHVTTSTRKSRHYFADSGGPSVGIVRLRTKATEVFFFSLHINTAISGIRLSGIFCEYTIYLFDNIYFISLVSIISNFSLISLLSLWTVIEQFCLRVPARYIRDLALCSVWPSCKNCPSAWCASGTLAYSELRTFSLIIFYIIIIIIITCIYVYIYVWILSFLVE
jgi:hypothetical protein